MRRASCLIHQDEKMNDYLGIEGLIVTRIEDRDIYASSVDDVAPVCDRCLANKRMGILPPYDGKMKNHGRKEKEYFDVITLDDGSYKVVKLHYSYTKYRCLDKNCHTTYTFPVSFARENSRYTKRFEDYVMKMAAGAHYSFVSLSLSYSKKQDGYTELVNTLTKQSVSDIIVRWTNERNMMRGKIKTPKYLGMACFIADHKKYVVVYDAGDPELRIIEIIPSIDRADIISFLYNINPLVLTAVITDCEPVIIEAVESTLARVEVLVNVESLLFQVFQEYASIILKDAPRIYITDKRILKEEPTTYERSKYKTDRIKVITEKYPRISEGLSILNSLRSILNREWDITEILDWKDKIPSDCKNFFSLSSNSIELYWNNMLKYYMRRNVIIGDSYNNLVKLNEIVKGFKFYSKELFKSRLLYIPELYNDQRNDTREYGCNNEEWVGVPFKLVYESIQKMINDSRRKKR